MKVANFQVRQNLMPIPYSLQQFTFVFLLKFWCPILSSVQRVTKGLQDPKIDLIQASDDLDGLNRIIDLKSEDIIKNAVRSASEYREKWNVYIIL